MKIWRLALGLAPLLVLCRAALGAPPPLHVVGNHLEDDKGNTVRLQGVDMASLEWSSGGDHVLESARVAIDQWHANAIRVPLCQDRWFGHGTEQTDGGQAYRARIAEVVKEISDRNAYAILDMHWNDGEQWGKNIGQHKMPDDYTEQFWSSFAAVYANNPAVLFDIYNEPHDVSWDVWRNGGNVTEVFDRAGPAVTLNYYTPGMQQLLDTIRSTGAKNVCMAGGLDWAYQLDGIVNGYALDDPTGNGVVYSTHIYPWKNDWDKHVTVAADKYPIYVGECGCTPIDPKAPSYERNVDPPDVWAPKVLGYIAKHGFSWTAWDFHTAAAPCLIQDWKYTPTPYWGEYVKQALSGTTFPDSPPD